PPSRADASALPPFDQALALVNACAEPVSRRISWTAEGPRALSGPADRDVRAVLADAAIDFFTGPDLAELRVCPAPRCVLYFLKRHPKQEWCSVACGNRARAARYYAQHKDDSPIPGGR
ncbi:CGNR zinc finger domain-containing protein, partial [Actinocorallia lasiicapitis]